MATSQEQRLEQATLALENRTNEFAEIMTTAEGVPVPVSGYPDQKSLATRVSEQIDAIASDVAQDADRAETAADEAETAKDTAVATYADLQNSTDPAKGAAIVGWARSTVGESIENVSGMLNSQDVSPLEYESLVVSKPSPLDPSTWDWAPALQAALDTGIRVNLVPGIEYRIASPIVCNSKATLTSSGGELKIDYDALGVGVTAFTFNGDGSGVYGVKATPLVVQSPYVEDADASCFHFTANDCYARDNIGDFHPRFIYSSGSDQSFVATGNKGQGYFDGQSQDSRNHHFIEVNNGERCNVSNNYAIGYAQAVLLGGSTNRSTINDNIGINCGNHVVYVSSGSMNSVCRNIGYGPNTDVKARGDLNVVDDNTVFGGVISYTNATADGTSTIFGDTIGSRGGSISGNTAITQRVGVSAISLSQRSPVGPTTFDVTFRGIRISNNTARGYSASELPARGILISSFGADGITCTGNVIERVSDDGVLSSPLPFTPANYKNMTFVGNQVSNCGAEGMQLSGDYITANDNVVRDVNKVSTGDNAGIRLAGVTNGSAQNNTIDGVLVGGGGAAIRETNSSDYNRISGNVVRNALSRIVKLGSNTIVEDVLQGSNAVGELIIAAGAQATATCVVPSASVGDFVEVKVSANPLGVLIYGYVTSSGSNTVTIYYRNLTAGSITVPAHTVLVRVSKR